MEAKAKQSMAVVIIVRESNPQGWLMIVVCLLLRRG